MFSIFWASLFVISHVFRSGIKLDSTCTLPNGGGAGTCKNIYECHPALQIIKNMNKLTKFMEYIKHSQCGYQGNVPMICCPESCTTAHHKPGICVNISSCPLLTRMLQSPTYENIKFVKKSRCKDPAGSDNVCCSINNFSRSAGNCPSTVATFPLDTRSICCGVESGPDIGSKIIGGTEASINQHPWLALIEYKEPNKDFAKTELLCGGTLISGRYVITAGHCVAGPDLTHITPVNVRLGEYDITSNGYDCVPVDGNGIECSDGTIIIPIEKTIPHPDYKPVKHSPNDIALIRLSETAPFTDYIRPICLPIKDMTINPPVNFTLYTAGWGAVSATKPSSSKKLFVDLPYVSNSQCQKGYNNVKLISGHVCAGGVAGKDSCKGDSGGPLMYQNGKTFEIIGIVSFGPIPCGLANVSGVYTKVYEYLHWIKDNIIIV